MSGGGDKRPKSMRQKQVLSAARDNPDATVEEIANQVPSATTELVQVVLNEHGDPAAPAETATEKKGDTDDVDSSSDSEATETAEDAPTAAHSNSATSTESPGGQQPEPTTYSPTIDQVPPIAELSEKQQAVLEAIAADPTATQRELADQLDVSAGTVSNRVNSIPGFSWSDRQSFVETISREQTAVSCSDGGQTSQSEKSSSSSGLSPDATDPSETMTPAEETDAKVEELESRIEALEADETIETEAAGQTADAALSDPELIHKVIHACVNSEAIAEEEELRVIRAILTS